MIDPNISETTQRRQKMSAITDIGVNRDEAIRDSWRKRPVDHWALWAYPRDGTVMVRRGAWFITRSVNIWLRFVLGASSSVRPCVWSSVVQLSSYMDPIRTSVYISVDSRIVCVTMFTALSMPRVLTVAGTILRTPLPSPLTLSFSWCDACLVPI